MDQQTLANMIGASRQWVVGVEKGKPRAEVGLVLRALDALGVALSIGATGKPLSPGVDIDQIIDQARENDP
jgi:HTH-type transcriptional regulator/antitoxin HipB